ncbi:hypothetical protein LIA77_08246 [Sarocladium implicatum]|nr:hypothetical protein LIA77_08246 [Sarocladium implicatum]
MVVVVGLKITEARLEAASGAEEQAEKCDITTRSKPMHCLRHVSVTDQASILCAAYSHSIHWVCYVFAPSLSRVASPQPESLHFIQSRPIASWSGEIALHKRMRQSGNNSPRYHLELVSIPVVMAKGITMFIDTPSRLQRGIGWVITGALAHSVPETRSVADGGFRQVDPSWGGGDREWPSQVVDIAGVY